MLTAKDINTLAAMAVHGNTKDAARHLERSEQTVRNNLSGIYLKLGARNAIEAFRAMGWLVPRGTALVCSDRCRPVRLEDE